MADATFTQEQFNRTFRLIGEFMFVWASLEAELNRSVWALLDLHGLDGAIATANISVRDKIHIVRTLVALYRASDDAEAKESDKLLIRISDMSAERNTVAHNMFAPADNSDGVKFFTVKAKGRLDIPDLTWSEKAFSDRYAAMMGAVGQLKAVVAKAVDAKRLHSSRRPLTLTDLSPSGEQLSPGSLLDPDRPALKIPGLTSPSRPATREKPKAPPPTLKGHRRRKD